MAGHRGPGRPLGSVNRSTAQWAAYVTERYGSPLDGPARMMGMPVADLARELGCSRQEAAEFRLQCIEFVAAYTHQEVPRAVAVDAQVGVSNLSAAEYFFAPGFLSGLAAGIVLRSEDAAGQGEVGSRSETPVSGLPRIGKD